MINSSEQYPGIRILESSRMQGGICLPPFLILVRNLPDPWLKQHEYGHYLQYLEIGFFRFYWCVGLPSVFNVLENELEHWLFGRLVHSVPHEHHYAETDANRRTIAFFGHLPGFQKEWFPTDTWFPERGRWGRLKGYGQGVWRKMTSSF